MVENGTDINALAIPTDFNNISDMELMKLTGQTDSGGQGSVLGRLSINYQTEDENDKPLPRGHFVLPVDGDNVYAKEVTFRPFIRLYAYSYWDNSEEEFTSSVQMPSLGDQFADSKGTYKCGKLSREEIERLPDNDPQRVIQSSIKCNQVLYGVATMVGKKSDEQEIKVKEVPCVFYAKGVNYIPFSTMLSGLVKQKKPMIRTNLIVSTKKQKSGGNTYFSVGIKTGSTVELSDTDKELLKEFMVAVKSVNESVMEKHRSAVKSKTKDGDHSLAIELDN
tara:strand:+ start:155 stop:991 length:837 start_codon:yes stop_codon:yes gene_type:complete